MAECAAVAQLPNQAHESGSTRVIIRLALRLTILAIFAASAGVAFAKALAALLWMSIILCAVTGAMRREPPFGPTLNHWDEMTAYAALFALIGAFEQSTSI
jgi:hypothetical protein